MEVSMFCSISVLVFSIVFFASCAPRGSEFLGTWVNARNPGDAFQIVRNGDQYLIVNKSSKVGATYEKGTLEVKGVLFSADLTYDRSNTHGMSGSTIPTHVLSMMANWAA